MKKKSIPPQDDVILLQRLLDDEQLAYEQLVNQYHHLMLSVARAIVGEAFAEEVVQEAWISAIKALPKFEGRASLKTWLLQIVSNGAKSRIRRENRTVSLDDGWQAVPSEQFDHTGHRIDDVLPWEEATPENLLENEQLQAIIENTFQSLPALQRATLTLYDLEGIKMKEVCNILDISASNARVLLHRARTTIHHAIDRYMSHQ